MARLSPGQKTSYIGQLNARIPPQALVGGKATGRPSGTVDRVSGSEIYEELVQHGATDTVWRIITVIDGTDWNLYDELTDTWSVTTLSFMRGGA